MMFTNQTCFEAYYWLDISRTIGNFLQDKGNLTINERSV